MLPPDWRLLGGQAPAPERLSKRVLCQVEPYAGSVHGDGNRSNSCLAESGVTVQHACLGSVPRRRRLLCHHLRGPGVVLGQPSQGFVGAAMDRGVKDGHMLGMLVAGAEHPAGGQLAEPEASSARLSQKARSQRDGQRASRLR